MELVIFVIILAVIPGMIANKKGRSFAAWWVYGLLVWPIALVHALLLDPQKIVETDALRPCPFCAELIKKQATKCRYCQSTVEAITGEPLPKDDGLVC